MLTSYFKIVVRNFLKNRIFSVINILGLALGISCFTVIVLFVEKEFSYDRFHYQPEQVYRIVKDFINNDASAIPDATTPPALAYTLRKDFPEVEKVTRFFPNWGRRNLLQYGDKKFYEMNLIRVDEHFFEVFDFPLVAGSKKEPFTGIHSILLTETTAKKYFGNENPIGKVMRTNINNSTDFVVSGILKDVPQHSHFTFDVLIPFESGRDPDTDWNWSSFYTYLRLKPETDPTLFKVKVQELFRVHQPTSLDAYHIQPLTDIHLQSKLKWELSENGDLTYVNILLIIAIFVIAIAGINYVNLVTAQSAKRAKEVGVRKINGAVRSLLIRQFLIESILTVLVALGLSVIMTTLFLPLTKPVIGYDLSAYLAGSNAVRIAIPACIVLIGIGAGLYPAFFLSSFQPLKVLRGKFLSSQSGISLRQSLVVFQFIISITLIIGALIITRQLEFIREKKLGFNPENILMLPNVRGGGLTAPGDLVEDLRKIPAVINVARADGLLGFKNFVTGVASKNLNNHISLNFMRVDYDFLPTMEIALMEGRNFSPDFRSDSTGLIINQKAAQQLGLQQPYVGQRLTWDDDDGKTHDVTIVGVVEDFHFTSFHEEIKPFGFILEVGNGSTFMVKVHSQNLAHTIEEIEKAWTRHNPEKPFEYNFQDEQMAKLHTVEVRFQKLFTWFTLLAILIACLGLLGLVTALADSKTKEIGIRKTLGASVTAIVNLLSGEFIRLVLIALLIASPLAWFAADFWLQGFAYRIVIGWEVFVIAGVAAIMIAFVTVSFKSIKAALANPVDSLRNE
jgi:putative ABC transport system permease protein